MLKIYNSIPLWLKYMIVTGLLVPVIGFIVAIFIYHGQKTPEQILTSAYYKLFGRPVTSWNVRAPENEGLSTENLTDLWQSLSLYNTNAFIVIRGGNIVFEQYSKNHRKTTLFSTAAMAKAVTAVPVLLSAVSEGKINLDDPLWKFYPKLKNDPIRSQILIKHLLYHTSGIMNVSFVAGKQSNLTGWKTEYYRNPAERFLDSMTIAPIMFSPGSKEKYSGVGYYSLAYAITRSIQGSEYDNIYIYLREKIMRPLGIPDTSWYLSYGKHHLIDGMNLYAFGSGAAYTARASARVGELMLNRGIWEGKTLIKPDLIDEVLARYKNSANNVSNNHGWTLNKDKKWPSLPPDAFVGIGGGRQITLVIPSLDLVMVRYGKTLQEGDETSLEALDLKLFNPLMKSIIGPSFRQ